MDALACRPLPPRSTPTFPSNICFIQVDETMSEEEMTFLSELHSLVKNDVKCFIGGSFKFNDLCNFHLSQMSSKFKQEVWKELLNMCESLHKENLINDLNGGCFLDLVKSLKMDSSWMAEAYALLLSFDRHKLENIQSFLEKTNFMGFLILLCIDRTEKINPIKKAAVLNRIISLFVTNGIAALHYLGLSIILFESDPNVSFSSKQALLEAVKEVAFKHLYQEFTTIIESTCWNSLERMQFIVVFTTKLNAYPDDKVLYTRNLLGLLFSGRVDIDHSIFEQECIQEFISGAELLLAQCREEEASDLEKLWEIGCLSLPKMTLSQQMAKTCFDYLRKQKKSLFPHIRQVIVNRWLFFLVAERKSLVQGHYDYLISIIDFAPHEYLKKKTRHLDRILEDINAQKAKSLLFQPVILWNRRASDGLKSLNSCKTFLEQHLNCFSDTTTRKKIVNALYDEEVIKLSFYIIFWRDSDFNGETLQEMGASLRRLTTIKNVQELEAVQVNAKFSNERALNCFREKLSANFLMRTWIKLDFASNYSFEDNELLKYCLPLFKEPLRAEKLRISLGISPEDYREKIDKIVLKGLFTLIQKTTAKTNPKSHKQYCRMAAELLKRFPVDEAQKMLSSHLSSINSLFVIMELPCFDYEIKEWLNPYQALFCELFGKLASCKMIIVITALIKRSPDSNFTLTLINHLMSKLGNSANPEHKSINQSDFYFIWDLVKKYNLSDLSKIYLFASLRRAFVWDDILSMKNSFNIIKFFSVLGNVLSYFNAHQVDGYNFEDVGPRICRIIENVEVQIKNLKNCANGNPYNAIDSRDILNEFTEQKELFFTKYT